MQPGVRMPSGVFQPGAQPGLWPGMMQAGVFQPGAQPGLVQPCPWPQGGVLFAGGYAKWILCMIMPFAFRRAVCSSRHPYPWPWGGNYAEEGGGRVAKGEAGALDQS